MSFLDLSVKDFTEVLASKAAVPGGGGASALVGAIGVALGNMVGNLTVGKKKYADVEEEVYALMDECQALREELLKLIDGDAEVFEPLSKAYGIPKDDPNRAEIMENALKLGCSVPMDIMRTICKCLDVIKRLGEIGSALAISDAGCGAVCCKAGLQAASFNVFINTKAMTDREYAEGLEKEAGELLDKYCPLADEIYQVVDNRIRG